MKYLFLIVLSMFAALNIASAHEEGNFVHSKFASDRNESDKVAILMVHFGTTHDDTRALTIEAINNKVKETFNEWDFFEAYTSRIVIKRLAERGVYKKTPAQMLDVLKEKGYKYVMIQPTNIIDGVEMEALQKEIDSVKKDFSDIRLGNPLLYTPEDYEKVILALKSYLPDSESVVLVGHGTYTPVTASYAMLDYMLKSKGLDSFHVGTIEGYPSLDNVISMLKKQNAKKVLLVPFMFVAGDHAKNDISVDWKEKLNEEGFDVSYFSEGLGQNPGIIELFVEHIRFAANHRMVDILDKKAKYAKGE